MSEFSHGVFVRQVSSETVVLAAVQNLLEFLDHPLACRALTMPTRQSNGGRVESGAVFSRLTISPPPFRVRSTMASSFSWLIQPIFTRSGPGCILGPVAARDGAR